MRSIDFETIKAYRAQTFRGLPGQRLHSKEEAIDYVNQRGFIFFWPIKNIDFPSLWTAVAGHRPVADQHDDPGHVTWGWKDSLLGKRVWYYAKVLRKKATIISLALLPYFYALSENYGSPEEDYLLLYEQGHMTQECKVVYEAVLANGPIDTIALRKAARMTSRDSDARFNKALTDLQADFKIVPVGVAEVGSWNYAFIYEVAARQYPEMDAQARPISERAARVKLVEQYYRSMGGAPKAEVIKLFGWTSVKTDFTLKSLVEAGLLLGGLEVTGQKGEWFLQKELLG